MSTLKADTVQSKSTNTDLTIAGDGSGVPNLEAGFKVGGVVGVPTASIQDDAITLAKMASGVDGVIITYDASGNPVHVGPGTDGQVLTSTGAGSPPAFEDAAGGGAWNLIGTADADDDASLTITGLTDTYEVYAIDMSGFFSATDTVQLKFQVGTASSIFTSSYASVAAKVLSSGVNTWGGIGGVDSIVLADNMGNEAKEGGGATLFLHRIEGGGPVWVNGTVGVSNQSRYASGGYVSGRYEEIVEIDRVLVKFSSGNITKGRMTVWGIAHA